MCCVETEHPSMRDINRYVKKYATNWIDSGLGLEINYDELAIIKKKHHSSLFGNFLANHLRNQT